MQIFHFLNSLKIVGTMDKNTHFRHGGAIVWINSFLIFASWFEYMKGHWTQDSFFQISNNKEYKFL